MVAVVVDGDGDDSYCSIAAGSMQLVGSLLVCGGRRQHWMEQKKKNLLERESWNWGVKSSSLALTDLRTFLPLPFQMATQVLC